MALVLVETEDQDEVTGHATEEAAAWVGKALRFERLLDRWRADAADRPGAE